MKLSLEEIVALGPMTMEEVLAILDGDSPEEAKARTALNASLHAEGLGYRDNPPSTWPALTFNWDLSPEGQRYALDGVKLADFQKWHPDGLRLGWVDVDEFDSKLCHFNRRDESELWDIGCASKLARAIAYLRRGLPITPPLVGPVKGKDELHFHGGNHRYAALKAAGRETTFPIYVASDDFEMVARIITMKDGAAA